MMINSLLFVIEIRHHLGCVWRWMSLKSEQRRGGRKHKCKQEKSLGGNRGNCGVETEGGRPRGVLEVKTEKA